ncbi:MAG: helix-turn-helix domain-containing protein [Coprobacter sp.]|nr:helix-turn-helix domain-containing protein [Coprobacter sp.]
MKHLYTTLLLLASLLGRAESSYIFTPINSSDGLSSNRVHALAQLPDERMVIITDGLINLYDGARFTYLHIDDKNVFPLGDFHGYARIYRQNNERLWIKEYKRLLLLDLKTEKFISNIGTFFDEMGVKEVEVADFYADSQKRLWVRTYDNRLLYKTPDNQEQFISDLTAMAGNDNRLLEINAHKDSVYLFFQSGLITCHHAATGKEIYRKKFEKSHKLYTTQVIYSHIIDKLLYFVCNYNGAGGQLFRYDLSRRSIELVHQADYWLNTFSPDNRGNIWLSCEKGLWCIDILSGSKKLISELHLYDGKVANFAINTQFCDKRGGMWLGTTNRGLYYYHPDRFRFKSIPTAAFATRDERTFRVNCFADRNDTLFIGTPHGLYRYESGNGKVSLYDAIPPDAECYNMLKEPDGTIWICASHHGLYRISDTDIRRFRFDDNVFYLYRNPDNSFFLAVGKGFCRFNPSTGECRIIESTLCLGTIYQLTKYDNNSLLGLSDAGIFIYNRKSDSVSITGTYETNRPPIFRQNNLRYDCLFTDSRGLIWIGTRDGLSVWNHRTNSLQSFHTENGLVNNRIQSIIEDTAHSVWVSTAGGLSCITLMPDGDGYLYQFTNYNHYDGLIATEFFERAAYRTTSGTLLWGGVGGFSMIDTTALHCNANHLPRPLFTRLLLSGGEVVPGVAYNGDEILSGILAHTDEITLRYDQNTFGIELATLNYINPSQTRLYYTIDDSSWNEIMCKEGIGVINFTRLSPGDYTLKAYTTDHRISSEACALLKIRIKPPFRHSTPAYILYILSLIVLAFVAIRTYRAIMRRRTEAKEKAAREKEQYLSMIKNAIAIHPDVQQDTLPPDKKLLHEALECVERNLQNPDYSVEQFSRDMNMERSGLFRKLKAVTGLSPNAFIRTIRLKHAASLLKQGVPVRDVAEQVGFGSISYFSKCFFNEFGVKPSQYPEKK